MSGSTLGSFFIPRSPLHPAGIATAFRSASNSAASSVTRPACTQSNQLHGYTSPCTDCKRTKIKSETCDSVLRSTAVRTEHFSSMAVAVKSATVPVQPLSEVGLPTGLTELVRNVRGESNDGQEAAVNDCEKSCKTRKALTTTAVSKGEGVASEREQQQASTNKMTTADSAFLRWVGIDKSYLVSLASQKATPLSLADMYRYTAKNHFGQIDQRLRNAQFLHRELPIRIAQRALDLMHLPHGLAEISNVREVTQRYLDYVAKFHSCPIPSDVQGERAFTNFLKEFIMDRSSIPTSISLGLAALKTHYKLSGRELTEEKIRDIEVALYRFFTARVGLRFLTEHHILSMEGEKKSKEECAVLRAVLERDCSSNSQTFLGCIQKNCDPVREARVVARQVREECRDALGAAPCIEIVGYCHQKDEGKGKAATNFTYVPHHLRCMLAELLKNSCRAVVRKHHGEVTDAYVELPMIKVVVVKGAEDVTMKISDQGGGVPRSVLKRMWRFSHETLMDDEDKEFASSQRTTSAQRGGAFDRDDFSDGHVRGFGLPQARIYARYFGGELTLKSMEGYGVDAYLYLPVLGEACENLPDRVYHSPGNKDSSAIGYREIVECDIDGTCPWDAGIYN